MNCALETGLAGYYGVGKKIILCCITSQKGLCDRPDGSTSYGKESKIALMLSVKLSVMHDASLALRPWGSAKEKRPGTGDDTGHTRLIGSLIHLLVIYGIDIETPQDQKTARQQ